MSDAQDAINDLLTQYQAKLSNVAPKSVGIQLVIMASLSVGTVLLFSILRPRNALVYAPRAKYSTEEKKPPKIDSGLFSWVRPLVQMKEPDMLVEMGLDAVIFLRFLRMCRWLFTSIALLTCGVLIPINIIYNIKNVPSSQRNPLSVLTIANVKGTSLWAHVAVSYIICFLTFWFIWINYRRVVELRHAYFRSAEYNNSLHARSIMITGVQRQYQTDQGLQSMLGSLGIPYPTTAVHIGRKVGHLPDMVDAHNDAVRELEQVLTTYTKDGRLAKKRPTMRIGGFLGMGRKRIDTIEYMTAKIKRLEVQVEQMRDSISDRKSETYGFASFSAVPYAHVVAKRLRGKTVQGCAFTLAPLPSDIIWPNLAKNHRSKILARFFIFIFLIFFCILYTVPLLAVSFLANLAAISTYVSFLDTWSNRSSWSFSAVIGIAPPLLSALLQLILPVIMRALTRRQGLLTHNQVDRHVLARYFAFLVVTQLIIFSLVGVVFNLITELVIEFGKGGDALSTILREVNKLPSRIQNTYLSQSNYWVGFMALRAWAATFDVAQVINLVWVWARARLFGRTPREIREWTRPPPLDFAVYFANSLLIVAVAFIYAPLAPIVALLAAVAFFASSFIYKYMLLYVCVTEHESGGRMWNTAINRLLVCLTFQQAILILTIGLQQGWIRSIACVPPIGLIIAFKIVLRSKFNEQYRWYSPTDQEVAQAVVHKSDARKNRLHKRFGNPSLHAELFTPMIHKKSQHLLRQIYSGRMGEDDYIGQFQDERKSAPAGTVLETGGLAFKAVEEKDLEQSREAYLREQEAWETGSVSTAVTGDATPMYRGDAAQGYFENKRREYLAHGPSRSETPTGYEMSRVPTNPMRPGESQEDLLDGLGQQGRNYAPGPYSGRYAPAAVASYEDVGQGYGPNASGFFNQAAPTYGRYEGVPGLPPAAAPYATPAPSYHYPPQSSPDPSYNSRQYGNGGNHRQSPSNTSSQGYFRS